jgi:hypothetical protein
MSITTHGLHLLGFRQLRDGETISAKFQSVVVYEVRGRELASDAACALTFKSDSRSCAVGIGGSLNGICQKLLGDNLVDDEQSWARERSCTPPFLVIHFGPTRIYTVGEAYVKEEESFLVTNDAFGDARDELLVVESELQPIIMASMESKLHNSQPPITFKPVHRQAWGTSDGGRRIEDIRFSASAEAYTSREADIADIADQLQGCLDLAARVSPKPAKFFHQASQESDAMKKFLFYFLCIEVETHRVFKSIDHTTLLSPTTGLDTRLRTSLSQFAASYGAKIKSLHDRFVLCAHSAWSEATDQHVRTFAELKSTRDKIAHGELSNVSRDDVASARTLASFVLSQRAPG